MMKVKIGADPELFVTQEGKFRSAHGLIPGTKEKPFPVNDGAVQVDGLALEYNINPAESEDDFVRFNQSVLGQLKDMVPGYDFAIVPSARFNGNHFRAQPEEAKELGCTPDFNAYTLKENPKPDNTTTMRTASGHLHLGFCEGADPGDQDHMIRCATLVKQLDCYLGLPSLLFDDDTLRRKMYGAAGAFRPKPYGVEYRVLSNAWLLNEDRMRFVYRQCQAAVADLIAGRRAIDQIGEHAVKSTINRSDVDSAGYYLKTSVNGGLGIYNEACRLGGRDPGVMTKKPKSMKPKYFIDHNFGRIAA
jgi:hypothetical protein